MRGACGARSIMLPESPRLWCSGRGKKGKKMDPAKNQKLRDEEIAKTFDHGELMTVKAVAALLHRSTRTIRTMCRIGRLQGVWNGPTEARLMGITRRSVDAFVEGKLGKEARA